MNKYRLTLIFLFLWAFGIYGQEQDSLSQNIKPYTVSEIPSNLASLDQLIEEVVTSQQPTLEYQLIVDSLDLFRENLQAVIGQIDSTAEDVPLQILEIQKNRIRQFYIPLRGWTTFLEDRTEEFEAFSEEIERVNLIWGITLEELADDEAPETISDEITIRLDSLQNVEETMKQRSSELLAYQVEINQMNQLIDHVIERLDENLDSRIWARDSAPFWSLEADTLPSNHGLIQLRNILVANKKSVEEYYNLYRPSFYLHFIVFLVILVALIRIRYVSSKHEEYQDLKFLYHALSRPVLSSILVSLIFAIWVYYNEPQVVKEAVGIIALISVIGIFYGFIHQAFRWPLVVLGFIYLFNYFQSVLPVGTLFQRSWMVVGSLVVIGYTIWVIRLFKTHRPEIKYGWMRMLVNLLPFAAFLLIGSLLANIFGSVRLSRIVLAGVIDSAALAIIFFGAVRVMSNVVAFLIRTPYVQVINLVQDNYELLEKRFKQFFQFFGFVLWLRSTLVIFGFLDRIIEWVKEIWGSGLTLGSVTITVGGVLGFFIILVISWWLARILQLILKRELFDRLRVSKGVPHAISTTIYYVFIALGFLLAVSYAGFDLDQISLVIGALGVGIGFGLQNVISNFVSGLILTFERPINVGDTVEVGPLMGNVSGMGLRSSKVKTFDGSEVIVPNSNLVTNEVINWTLSDSQRRLTIPVSTAYGTDPHKVLEIMKTVVTEHPRVLQYPAPLPLFDGFGDSSLKFRVLFWVHFDESLTIKSTVGLQIYDALKEHGIDIPVPLRRITMESESGDDAES